MKTLTIEGTLKTPNVMFDGSTGIMEIKGRSIPENTLEFYTVLVEWLGKYSQNPQPQTVMNIHFEYFNTSTSKVLLDVFKKLEIIQEINQGVTVNWLYDEGDEDMMDAGEDYSGIMSKIPFKITEAIAS